MADAGGKRSEELLELLCGRGEEVSAEALATMHRELLRRLGGPRRDVRKRLVTRAFLFMAVGVILVAAGVAMLVSQDIAAPEARIFGGILEILLGVGLALMASGILLRRKWAVGKNRRVSFAGRDDLEIYNAEPPTEALLGIVGPDRGRHSADELSSAENALKDRIGAMHERNRRRIRQWAWTAIIAGLYLSLPGLILGVFLSVHVVGGNLGWNPQVPNPPWQVVCFITGFSSSAWLFVAGGLGFRKMKQWGRKLIIAALWVLWVAMSATLLGMAVWTIGKEWDREALLMLVVFIPVALSTWLSMVLRARRALRLPEIMELCEGPGEKASVNP